MMVVLICVVLTLYLLVGVGASRGGVWLGLCDVPISFSCQSLDGTLKCYDEEGEEEDDECSECSCCRKKRKKKEKIIHLHHLKLFVVVQQTVKCEVRRMNTNIPGYSHGSTFTAWKYMKDNLIINPPKNTIGKIRLKTLFDVILSPLYVLRDVIFLCSWDWHCCYLGVVVSHNEEGGEQQQIVRLSRREHLL